MSRKLEVQWQVDLELRNQSSKWSLEHDMTHENFEWLGLIAQYAAHGEYVKAAALCISAEIAQMEKKYYIE